MRGRLVIAVVAVALLSSGCSMWAFGTNASGQLGDGTTTPRPTPVQIGGATWKSVSAGEDFACGIRPDDTLWCWGEGSSGQIGNGSTAGRAFPVPVGTAQWRSVSARYNSTCAVRSDNTLWCWGDNSVAQLGDVGDGSTTTRRSPVHIGTASWSTVDVGMYMATCGLRTDSTLWCWGDNESGQLGDGTTTPRHSPVRVGTETNWFGVDAGGSTTQGFLHG